MREYSRRYDEYDEALRVWSLLTPSDTNHIYGIPYLQAGSMHKDATLIGIDLEQEAITAAAERLTEKSRRLNGPRPPTNITLIHADVFDSDDKVCFVAPEPDVSITCQPFSVLSSPLSCAVWTGGAGTRFLIKVSLFAFSDSMESRRQGVDAPDVNVTPAAVGVYAAQAAPGSRCSHHSVSGARGESVRRTTSVADSPLLLNVGYHDPES
jgi:hypothetical protein